MAEIDKALWIGYAYILAVSIMAIISVDVFFIIIFSFKIIIPNAMPAIPMLYLTKS
jgi:hypothetical protein